MKADTWHSIETYMRKRKKYSNWTDSEKLKISKFFGVPFGPQGTTFEHFNRIQLIMAARWLYTEAVHTKRKKVTEQFVRKWPNSLKICIFLGPKQAHMDTLVYFNGNQLIKAARWRHTEAKHAKRKKNTELFLRKWEIVWKLAIFLKAELCGANLALGGPLSAFQWRVTLNGC